MQGKNSLLILVLSLAVFGVITTEMGIIGLLPQLADQLHVTPTQVGLLVSIYAVAVAVTGPFITLLMSGLNKKTVLVSILVVFVVSNVLFAVTNMLQVMLVLRILPALFHAVFFAVALVVAAQSAPRGQGTQAAAKVFAGVAAGLVLGVPLSTLVAEHVSLAAAFGFAAAACLIAMLGILWFVPSMPTPHKVSFSSQLSILKRGRVWLAILTVTLIFAAMFSSFSYIAEYLKVITGLGATSISLVLILFGVCGMVGNFVFSGFLQRSPEGTTRAYPVLFTLIFILVWLVGGSLLPMCALIILWGGFHSSGLLISQTWLLREAGQAPEFANSLYISFSNLGITIGSLVGGWFIVIFGTRAVVLSSIVFALLAFVSIFAQPRSEQAMVRGKR
jgi:DHA1 family inner membrane transport protein